jgi:N6-adenosine-specific RNA methylase IME4
MTDTPRSLLVLTKARKMLAEARTLDEFKSIHHDGQTFLRWAKSRRDVGLEAMNEAAEIVITAERRMGDMLAGMDGKGSHGGNRKSKDIVSLDGLGIHAKHSQRWQAMARVPQEQFELFVEETRAAGKQLTSGAVVKLGKRSHRKKWAEDSEPTEGVVANLQDLIDAGSKFQCIYADPPWGYSNQQTRASTDNHYGTMTVEQIAAEPVVDVAADSAHLHLWTTNAFLFDAQRIIEAWGFEYRSCYVWVKPQMGIGNYWRVSHEFMLLGIRGKATNFLTSDQTSWGQFGRTSHSRKPKEIRQIIEKVSPGPYLEMYGRERLPGWIVYGNQIEMRPLAP